jgi:hypothetical protein
MNRPVAQKQLDTRLHVQMIGDPGVGKTSFLGALGLINRSPRQDLVITPVDSDTKRRLDDLHKPLIQGHWPSKTFHGESFTFQLHRHRQTLTIEIDDIAGESFVNAMRRGDEDEHSVRTTDLIRQADLLLLMVDGGKLDGDQPLPQSDLIQAVNEKRITLGHLLPHVAVVVTKADLCINHPIRTSPQTQKRVSRRMPALSVFLKDSVEHTHWFAISVCGFNRSPGTDSEAVVDLSLGGGESIDPFSPAGFEQLLDLFLTLADHPKKTYRRVVVAFLVAVVFSIFAALRYGDYEIENQLRMIQDPQVRIQELPAEIAARNESVYRGRVLDQIRAASNDVRDAISVREVDDILLRISDWPTLATRLAGEELIALERQAQQSKEKLLYQRVTDAAQSGDAVKIGIAVDQYLNLFPSGPHAETARSLLSKQEDKRRSRARQEIQSVTVRDAATLERKLELISKYVDQFESVISPVENEQIRIAIDAARVMLRPSRYDVTLVRTAGLDRPRAHGVVVSVDGEEIAKFDDSGAVSEKIWNRAFQLRWQLGKRIEIQLLNYRYRNNTIAYFDATGALDILMLARRNQATKIGDPYLSDPPPVTVTFKCDQLPDATVTAIKQWIFPGEAW